MVSSFDLECLLSIVPLVIFDIHCIVSRRRKEEIQEYNNNTTTSQYGSRFWGVCGGPDVGSVTSTGISVDREVESRRPTKQDFVKTFYRGRIL